MESRKVQLSGGSSHIITLPKKWINEQGIVPGDQLNVLVRNDGSLHITSRNSGKRSDFSTRIVERPGHIDLLFRQLVGAYVAGCTSILIVGNPDLSPEAQRQIRKWTRTVIGVEVVEEDKLHVLLKDVLQVTDLPPQQAVQRMYSLVHSMIGDMFTAVKKWDVELAKEVQDRDEEIDRLYWFLEKQYNILSGDGLHSEVLEDGQADLFYNFLVGRVLERIADHTANVFSFMEQLEENKPEAKLLKNISASSDMALSLLDQAYASFIDSKERMASQMVDSYSELRTLYNKGISVSLKLEANSAVSLSNILEAVRRIGKYSTDIAELAINRVAASERSN